jgi:hypothetical protein
MLKTMLSSLFLILAVLVSLKAVAFEDNNSIELGYGPSTHSLDLKSDAFSASQSYVQGQGFQGSYINYSGDGGLRTEISYSELANTYLTSPALTPKEISVKNQTAEISMQATALTVDQHKFLRFGLGYVFIRQTSDQTKPNVLVVNSETQALELKVRYDLYKANDFVINVGAGLGLPFRNNEYGVQSGVNIKSTILKGNINLRYYLGTSWSLLAKLNYFTSLTSADGAGNRGTLNSTETEQTFFLPIGFSYDF